MEGCEGCHTYLKCQKLGKDILSFCPLALKIERDEIERCPCMDCIVMCVCIDACQNYYDVVDWSTLNHKIFNI